MSDVHRSATDDGPGPAGAEIPVPSGFRPPIEVVVAHPDPTVRLEIAQALTTAGITVVGETGDGNAAVALTRELVPDVAILATGLPGRSGVEGCRDLRTDLPVVRVLLVADADDAEALAGLEAGAYGCWLRGTPQTGLVEAVRGTMRRESLPTPGWAAHILTAYAELEAAEDERVVRAPRLTPTEHDVLSRIAEGRTPDEVAAEYEVTSHMVRLHTGYAIVKLYRALADERQMQSLRA